MRAVSSGDVIRSLWLFEPEELDGIADAIEDVRNEHEAVRVKAFQAAGYKNKVHQTLRNNTGVSLCGVSTSDTIRGTFNRDFVDCKNCLNRNVGRTLRRCMARCQRCLDSGEVSFYALPDEHPRKVEVRAQMAAVEEGQTETRQRPAWSYAARGYIRESRTHDVTAEKRRAIWRGALPERHPCPDC